MNMKDELSIEQNVLLIIVKTKGRLEKWKNAN